jgi:hypothetical protein
MMDDAESTQQQARIDAFAEAWVHVLGLSHWRIRFVYEREYILDDDQDADIKSLARCTASWEYMDARIVWNLTLVKTTPDDQLEMIVCHEFCHILLAEMSRRGSKRTEADRLHEEHTATIIAKAFIWVRNATRDASDAETEPTPPSFTDISDGDD